MATNKVIVTHAGALKTKYGSQGLSQIRAGLGAMVAADGERAITTRVVAIDSARDMARFSKPTGTPATTREAKAAIDTIYAREQPDYIMILGAPDVIPLQSLSNPLYEPGGDDDDRSVPSDLPYACNARMRVIRTASSARPALWADSRISSEQTTQPICSNWCAWRRVRWSAHRINISNTSGFRRKYGKRPARSA